MEIGAFAAQLDAWGKERLPFFFAIDFEREKPFAALLGSLPASTARFDLNGFTNTGEPRRLSANRPLLRTRATIPFLIYKERFDLVQKHLAYGDTFLANLTIKTEVEPALSLRELFDVTRARYKLLLFDSILVFSPETFVRIENNTVSSYPMKGTIDARWPDARKRILSDRKEMAEHVTIVDLIRNDLSSVADDVRVKRFRYVEPLATDRRTLLQVSSEITGRLPPDWPARIGTLLMAMLPAGSVSGAPKPKTLEIIRAAEGEPRGYYTGVTGYFDGQTLDSGVMIRYIEQSAGTFYYRSGGGITSMSDVQREYEEAIEKVYIPVQHV